MYIFLSYREPELMRGSKPGIYGNEIIAISTSNSEWQPQQYSFKSKL